MGDFMKVDAARLDRAAVQGAGEPAAPAPGDVDAFERAMGLPEERNAGRSGGEAGGKGGEFPASGDVDASERAMERPHERDAGRSGCQIGGKAGDSAASAPGDVDALGRAMKCPEERNAGRSGGQPGGKGGDADEAGDEAAGSRSSAPMTNPLDTLFAGRMEAAPAPSAAAAAEAAPPADLDGLAERLVDRILVSQPGEGAGEVRIRLGGDVLPGTEISLKRGADGLLSVRLATTDAASFQTLVGAQDSLKARLEHLEKDVRVDVVSERGGSGAENNDARRRSRGFYAAPDDAV